MSLTPVQSTRDLALDREEIVNSNAGRSSEPDNLRPSFFPDDDEPRASAGHLPLARSKTVSDLRNFYERQHILLSPHSDNSALKARVKKEALPRDAAIAGHALQPPANGPASAAVSSAAAAAAAVVIKPLDLSMLPDEDNDGRAAKAKGKMERAVSAGNLDKIKRASTFPLHATAEPLSPSGRKTGLSDSPLSPARLAQTARDSPVRRLDSAQRIVILKERSHEEPQALPSPTSQKRSIFAKFKDSFRNDTVRKKFERSWASSKLQLIEPLEMGKLIASFCRQETDKMFVNVPDPSSIPSGQLLSSESPRSREILDQFLKNWNLLKLLICQFKEWEQLLSGLSKTDPTPLMIKLQHHLMELIRSGEPLVTPCENPQNSERDISLFIKKLNSFLWEDKEISSFIFSIWDVENAKKLIEALQLCPERVREVHYNRNREIVSIANVLRKPPLPWREMPTAKYPISNITLYEVKRCLPQFTKGSFSINGFEPAVPECGSDTPLQKALLRRILGLIYNPQAIFLGLKAEEIEAYKRSVHYRPEAYLIGRLVADGEIEELVNRIFAEEPLPWDHPLKPGELLLRLMTMSCWNRGDELIKLRYPDLFNSPYIDKRGIDNSCHINILGPGNFTCMQIKCYGTYLRIRPDDKECRVIKDDSLCLKTWFSWSVYPCQDEGSDDWYWGGEQGIQRIEIMESVSNDEERRRLLNILNNPQIDLDRACEFQDVAALAKSASSLASPRASPLNISKSKSRDAGDGAV